MKPIKVVVQGALGRVGQEVVKAVCAESEMQLVGAVDLKVTQDSLALPDGSGSVPFSADIGYILTSCQPEVLVDFTIASAIMPTVRIATERGVSLVIGTTGLTKEDLNEIDRLATAHKVGAVVAPNFALGAVLMIHLAKIAAKYLDYAEIIELHHYLKADAPSGTALATARAMAVARGKPFLQPTGKAAESRGQQVEGATIHSVRLPGLMAHQEVILGGPGQTVSIRHDTINRECYMPGVMLAIKEVVKRRGLIYGLDTLLGL
ncbi:MAG TPA: 4-hydroxy-tetrahydrodipicolinate reductase [Dehalococcoidales bacterium]|nr:4-hydroxy-tetrahydrodipicolinate reductase [Dehalococcoidales bacterium]